MQASPSSNAIQLKVRGLGHVPSFKNSKVLFLTNARNKAWMRLAAESFESQLRCAFRTHGIEIPMEQQALYWIASSMPLDDSLAWIAELSVNWQTVTKGEEGADILIEPMASRKD